MYNKFRETELKISQLRFNVFFSYYLVQLTASESSHIWCAMFKNANYLAFQTLTNDI